jgi:hypothetical protein
MSQQRFRFFQTGAVDDPVLLRIQTGAEGFSQLRMGRQDEKGFHQG